ncbi:MAG TPA: hypothetical protein PK566_13485 [Pseudobacteroides sp.]|nr:hypothetical protein [Pseudobacteroides sp.]
MLNWKKEIAKENYEIFKEYRDQRLKWFKDAIKYNNFRKGFHFSAEEIKDILKQRQAPIPINVTTAICETAESLLTSSDPVISVMPARFITEENRKIAQAVAYKYEAALKSTWYNSLGGYNYDKVIQDYNNVGRGLMYIVPKFKDNEFFVDMKYLSFRDFYPDPNTRDPHYKDSENMIISYVTGLSQAFRIAKMYDPELEWEQFKNNFKNNRWLDNDEVEEDKYVIRGTVGGRISTERIRLIFRTSLEEQKIYYVTPIQNAPDPNMYDISIELYLNYQGQNWFEVPNEIKQYVQQGLLEIHEKKGMFLNEYISIGEYGIKKAYPIDSYNIIPFVYDDNEHPYPLGRVHYIYPLQRALNKCIMIAILNASLSNNLKWVAEDKTIVNAENWTNNSAIPGSIMFWRRLTSDTQPPIPVQPMPLSDVFLQFPRYLQYVMEYVSGITGVLMGTNDEKTPDVFRTVAAMQSAGGERIKRRLRNLDTSLSVVGETIAKFYKEYAPMNGETTWVEGINKVKSEMYNVLKPDPNDPTKIIIQPDTDLSIGFRSIRFVSTSNQGYENANIAQMLTLMATQLSIPEIVPVILKKLNIPETEEIIEALDIKKQAQMSMQEMQQRVQQLEQISQRQAQEIENKAKQINVEKFNHKLVRTLESIKTKFKDDLNSRKEIDDLLNAFDPNNQINNEMNNEGEILQ